MFSPVHIRNARAMYDNIHKTIVNTAKQNDLVVNYGYARDEPILTLKHGKTGRKMFELYVVVRKFEIVMMSKVPATDKLIHKYSAKKRKAKDRNYKFEFEIFNDRTLGFAKFLIKKAK